jgi:predicted Zn-dependent protease
MAKRAATISPSSGDVEVYIAQAKASIAAELAPAAAAVSPFMIEVRFLGGLTPKQKNAFKSAADRWSRVIVGDLPSVKVDNEVIDDVVILAQGSPIDGVGRILGQAGPTHLRPQSAGVAAFLPAKGKMTFDRADLKQMEQDDTLNDVITHEMGHVLGIGTVWTFKSLLKGAGKTNPTFLGKAAMKEFGLLKGPTVKPTPVPVENTGGPGTADSHWRETVFRNEMMTGFVGVSGNPLSRMTVASLQDLGYVVDLNAAEPYSLPNLLVLAEAGLLAAPVASAARGIVLPNIPILLPETSLQ